MNLSSLTCILLKIHLTVCFWFYSMFLVLLINYIFVFHILNIALTFKTVMKYRCKILCLNYVPGFKEFQKNVFRHNDNHCAFWNKKIILTKNLQHFKSFSLCTDITQDHNWHYLHTLCDILNIKDIEFKNFQK